MKIVANGIEVHYQLDGRANAPLITLSHSLGASLRMWEPQVAALSVRYRVLRYDTRGHGESETTPGAYTLALLAADVRALLGVLGISKTHFVGISMGGMIGQCLALDHAEVLSSLVLCDTKCELPFGSREAVEERVRLVESHGTQVLVEATLERWLSDDFRRTRPELVEQIAQGIRGTNRAGYVGCCRAISELDYRARLSEIAVPTLVVVGAEDQGTTVDDARVLAQGIPGACLSILPHARHLASLEQAELFNRELLFFLAAIEEQH
jgi:3-oxoadipate enol-lactonase